MIPRRLAVHVLPFAILAFAAGCDRNAPTPGGAAQGAQASDDPAADRAAVEAAVAAHWKAINEADSMTVLNQHTSDLTMVLTDLAPRITSTSPELASLMDRWRGSKPHWTVQDLQIQLFRDVAVATFYLDGSTTWADGTMDTRRRRVTEVWARQPDGTWKEAHHHDSVFASQ